ncbi:hypothetical protein N7534_008717 [Penicillium rubens]|nr:hypothetical protein N7534_008717 [Penicillium rubens]
MAPAHDGCNFEITSRWQEILEWWYAFVSVQTEHLPGLFTSLTSSPSFLKTELLRGSPVKGRPRKDWSVRTAYTYPTESERASFDFIQAAFQDPQWLSHWDRTRRVYFDIDASQEGGHGAMVFHIKRDYTHTNLKQPPPSTAATELEISCLVWVVRKIRQMIEAAPDNLTPIAYTDHIATINLATSLSSVSPDRMNLRLVRVSQYLQQFRFLVYHKAGKLNNIADALPRLPAVDKAQPREDDDLDALHVDSASDLTLPGSTPTWDVPDEAYAFLTSCVQLSEDCKTRVRAAYEDDPKWSLVLSEPDAPSNLTSIMSKYAFTTVKSTIDKRTFDNAYNPGVVFFPTDLEFFIEWEKADQARRKEAVQNGAHIRRSPPTAAAYKAHQVE